MKFKELLSVIVGGLSALALAEPFVYVDHWPSGSGDETATEVTVNTATAAIATATDVERVRRLTAITLSGTTSKVTYSAADPLALTASVSGDGTFRAENSGRLTILGDNSGLSSSGRFELYNSPVVVSNRFGLGCSTTKSTKIFFGKNSSIDFGSPTGVFTNDVAIVYDLISGSGGSISFGTRSASEELYQNADFLHLSGAYEKAVYIRNSMHFIGGRFGKDNVDAAYLYVYKDSRSETSKAHVWFEGTCSVRFQFAMFLHNTELVTHFGAGPNYKGSTDSGYGVRNAVFEGADALVGGGVLMPFDGNTAVIDLNGCGQRMSHVHNQYIASAYYTVKSAAPALLTTTSTQQKTMAAKFVDAAGYRHESAGTNTLTQVSTSTNLLDVAAGKVLLGSSASWAGSVTVRSGAELEVQKMSPFADQTVLTVEAGGSLVLAAGVKSKVRKAILAGTELDAGETFTVAELKGMGLPVAGDDAATLSTAAPTTWEGWPTRPGAKASVPDNFTVGIADSDVPVVAALSKISLGVGATVVCTNGTVPLALGAKVSGSGTFKVLDSAGIVLNGDNSALVSPGCFFFSNSYVTVSNRYGLGSSSTARTVFHYGSLDASFNFGGAGLTNDAPIYCYPGLSPSTRASFVFGPQNPGEVFVQNNDFRFPGGGGANTLYFRGKLRFAGGTFGTASDVHIYSSKADAESPAEIWFDSGVTVQCYYFFAGGGKIHANWSGLKCSTFISWASDSEVDCEGDDVFIRTPSIKTLFGGHWAGSVLDLNGHDQTLSGFLNSYNDGGDYAPLTIRSSTPATLTVTGASAYKDAYVQDGLKFCGFASYTHDFTGTNVVSKYFSDTQGTLTVAKGTVKLIKKAGWGGDVRIDSGARLVVASDSAATAFRTASMRSRTVMTVEAGGVLEIQGANRVKVDDFIYDGVSCKGKKLNAANCPAIAGDGSLSVAGGLSVIIR